MDAYGETIEKMAKFLEEEPSGNFTAIDRHSQRPNPEGLGLRVKETASPR